jgi:hypothetical protein
MDGATAKRPASVKPLTQCRAGPEPSASSRRRSWYQPLETNVNSFRRFLLNKVLIIPAAIVVLSLLGAGLALALEEDSDTASSPAPSAEQQLRADLAARLGVDIADVSVKSYQDVTWPDGCLGVINPAALCVQGLTDGYLAVLSGPDGTEYRYHGGGQDHFIAVDFEPGIVGVQEPVGQ